MKQVLVLNASYEVMKIVNWKKAILWFFKGKIDIIEEYNEYINTTSVKIKFPAVVKYKNLIKPKYKGLKFSRLNVYARDNFVCQYCVKKIAQNKLTLDHILPRSRGGTSTWTNCVSCCVPCNVKKSNKTPKEANMKLIQEPRQPLPHEIFSLAIRLKTIIIPEVWKNYSLPLLN